MSTSGLVIIVTGANKGIGYEIVRKLARDSPTSYLARTVGVDSVTVYLTARDEKRGRAALESLKHTSTSKARIEFAQLDVSSPSSIKEFKSFITSRHDKVHAIINNAGVAPAVAGNGGTFDSPTVEWVLSVNYDGARNMTNAFLPIIHDEGRVVNVSSGLGRLDWIPNESLRERFRAAASVAEADALIKEFRDGVKDGSYSQKGWPAMSYTISKAGLNALTRGFAVENAASRPKLLFSHVEPGWVTTEMGGPSACDGDAADGADTPSFVAIDDIGGKSGKGWKKRSEVPW